MSRKSKEHIFSEEERRSVENSLSFVNQNITSFDPCVQKQVIKELGSLWNTKNPPEELQDDIVSAKIILMNIVGADDCYPNFDGDARQYAINTIWDCVVDYAHKCIHKYAKTYVNTGNPVLNKENVCGMEAEEWIATATYIHTYNPKKGQPLTFLKQCFIHGIFEWKKKKASIGANSSMTALSKRISHIKTRLESEGREVTLQVLHDMIPDQSLDALQTALITLEASDNMASLESCTEILEARSSTLPIPEEAALEQEKNEIFYAALKKLPKEELAVYCLANGIDLTDESVSLPPHSALEISRLMHIQTTKVTYLVSRAEQDMYTILTGHRRNDRLSPNHRPDNIIKSSCDEIHFMEGDSDFVDGELASFAESSDNDDPQISSIGFGDFSSIVIAESM